MYVSLPSTAHINYFLYRVHHGISYKDAIQYIIYHDRQYCEDSHCEDSHAHMVERGMWRTGNLIIENTPEGGQGGVCV